MERDDEPVSRKRNGMLIGSGHVMPVSISTVRPYDHTVLERSTDLNPSVWLAIYESPLDVSAKNHPLFLKRLAKILSERKYTYTTKCQETANQALVQIHRTDDDDADAPSLPAEMWFHKDDKMRLMFEVLLGEESMEADGPPGAKRRSSSSTSSPSMRSSSAEDAWSPFANRIMAVFLV
jgi:hypothetical protein